MWSWSLVDVVVVVAVVLLVDVVVVVAVVLLAVVVFLLQLSFLGMGHFMAWVGGSTTKGVYGSANVR